MDLRILSIAAACCEMPFLKKPVRDRKTALSSSADLAEVTISLALQTVLMDDRDRLDARRWVTNVSRDISSVGLVGEARWDSEAWLWLPGMGEVDIADGARV